MPPAILKNLPARSARSYSFLRFFLFHFCSAEGAHNLAIANLRRLNRLGLLDPNPPFRDAAPVEVMGLRFPNVLGLAAGMDKGAACVDGFGSLGFGHVEVGTLTPRPQPGNPLPRIFRLVEHEALINRLGFNNPGIEAAIENLAGRRFTGILGINIGKNFDTPNDRALDDYLACLKAAYPVADYITVNLSSPNTVGLRDLQEEDACRSLIQSLKEEQLNLESAHGKRVPIAIKIAPAPDLADDHIDALARVFLESEVDAVIATNTTLDRTAVAEHPDSGEKGGLSGRPLARASTDTVRRLHAILGDRVPIIGVGGIFSAGDALEKMQAGARLVQIYTGLVYRGPGLVREIVQGASVTSDQ